MFKFNQNQDRPPAQGSGALIVIVLLAILIPGCAADMPNMAPSKDVASQFQNYEMIPGYGYYHYSIGFFRRTYALIGLDSAYRVDSRLWRQIDAADGLKSFVDNMIWISQVGPRGYLIKNPQQQEVGVWYSSLYGSSVRFADDNRVVPLVHEPFKGRDGGP